MWVILFAVVVIVLMTVQMFFEQKKRRKALEDYKKQSGSHFRVKELGEKAFYGQILTVVLCLFLGVYIYLNPASVKGENVGGYIGLSVLLAISFALNMVFSAGLDKIFYNKDTFYLNGEIVRFQSVKSFKKRAVGGYEIELYSSSENIKVPKIAVNALQELLDEKKREKANKGK